METLYKGPADYHALEAYIGMPFFCDAGRTAISSELVSETAQTLASQNPSRYWMFKVATREYALDTPDTDPTIQQIRGRLGLINGLETYIANYESGMSGSKLTEHQNDVFHDLANFMRGNTDNPQAESMTKAGFIEMPTGTGKTVVFTELLKAFHADKEHPIKSLVLVPTKEILKQTVGQKDRRGFAEFAPGLNVTSYYSDQKDLSGEVVVMTYQSFNIALENGVIDKDFCDVVICDEAHRALGSVTRKNVESFIENKVAVGLTATSEYGDNKKVEQLFPERIHVSRLRDAINQGILAPVQCWVYKTDVEIDKKLSYPDFTPEELQFLAQLEGRNRKAVEFVKGFVEQGLQGLVSCLPGENVLHPKLIADMLRETIITDPTTGEQRPIRAQELSGQMTITERNQYYHDFEAGKYDALTFVDTIAEGWDSQCAKFLINVRPTCSPVFGVQRFGRILRPNGQIAHVVEFIDMTQKAQFVALHSLGEYRYVLGRVYGSDPNLQGLDERKVNFPEDLKGSITRVNMVQVQKLVMGREYIPEYTDFVSMKSLADRLGVHPLSLVFIARDQNIPLRVEGENVLDVENIKVNDMSEESLQMFLRYKKYGFLRKLDDELLQAFVTRQAEVLAGNYIVQKGTDKPKVVVSPELAKATPEKLLSVLKNDEIDFHQLPAEAKQTLATADLPTSMVTQLLFSMTGGSKDSLRKIVFTRFVKESHNPMYLLNHASQVGHVASIKAKSIKSSTKGRYAMRVEVELPDGQSFAVQAESTTPKSVRHHANMMALGKLVGFEDVVADNMPQDEIPEDLMGETAREMVLNFSQQTKTSSKPSYETTHALGKGKHMIFTSTAQLKLGKDKVLQATGNGTNKREAEEAAALKLIGSEEILAWRSGRVVLSSRERKIIQYFKKGDPITALTRIRDKRRIRDLEYDYVPSEDAGGFICTVHFTDTEGQKHRYTGTGRGKQDAKVQAVLTTLCSDLLIEHVEQSIK